MNRTAIYTRSSSENQQDRRIFETKVEFAIKYRDLHQLDVAEWYKDDDVTGTITLEMRPAGEKLLEGDQAARFDLLLIYRPERLGRSA